MSNDAENPSLSFLVNDQQTEQPDYRVDTVTVTNPTGAASSHTYTAAEVHIAGIIGTDRFTVTYQDGDSASLSVDSDWNSIKNVLAQSDGAADVSLTNVVNTDVRLGDGGDSAVTIVGAKRGDIVTASGNDTIDIAVESNDSGWDNTFNISSSAGNDFITISGDTWTDVSIDAGSGNDSIRLTGSFDDLTLKGAEGGDAIDVASAAFDFATIDAGAGDDVVTVGAGAGTADRADGGVGSDTLVVSLSVAQYTEAVFAELKSFQRFAEDPANQGKIFTFATLEGLQARNFEHIQLLVDGQPVRVGNHDPVAETDQLVIAEDTALAIPVSRLLANDRDQDGDTLTITEVSNASGGSVTLANGQVIFTPSPDFNGQARFDYVVSDGHGGSARQTVTVNVMPVNDAPVGKADLLFATAGTALMVDTGSLLANDSDPDGDPLIVTGVGNAKHGTVTLTVDNKVIFTPEAGFLGTAGFEYTVRDPSGATSTVRETVIVQPVLKGTGALTSLAYSSESQVNTTDGGNQYTPGAAVLADGTSVVVWQSSDGSDFGVYFQRFDGFGAKLGGEGRVNTYTSASQYDARVVALAGGGFVVGWASEGEDGDRTGVYLQRYDAEGHALGGEIRANTFYTNLQYLPELAALSDGGFVAIWTSNGEEPVGYVSTGIYGQRYDAHGVPVGGEFAVNATQAYNQWSASTTGLPDGGWVVAWTSYAADGTTLDVRMRRYNAQGVTSGDDIVVNSTTGGDQSYPAVAALADGGWVVSWQSSHEGADSGIYAQVYNADGIRRGGEFHVNTYTNGKQVSAKVTGLADGGFVVGWESAGEDGSGGGNYLQRFDRNGVPVGGEFRLNETTDGDQAAIRLAARPDGGFLATWSSDSLSSSQWNIQSRIYSASPTGQSAYQGGTGADTLFGSSGDDTLIGGAGADTYLSGRNSGADTVDNCGHGDDGDVLVFGNGVAADQLWFQHVGNDLKVSIIGESSGALVHGWYQSGSNRVAEFQLSDGSRLLAGQVENLVSAMAGMTSPPAGQLNLTEQQHQQLAPVIAAAWYHS